MEISDNNLVSVIMPIYNAESFLAESIDSILEQSYSDFELILVNDGSDDGSERICSEYLTKDNRLRYYSKKNTGVSDSRNYGLSVAQGKYISFVDSDDKISTGYLEKLVELINQYTCQLACCSLVKYSKTPKINSKRESKDRVYVVNDKFDLINGEIGGYACTKLFLKDIIMKNNISFRTDLDMCEDMIFVFDYLDHVSKIACTDERDYFYRNTTTSVTKDLTNKKWFSVFKALDLLSERENTSKFWYAYLFYLYEAVYRLQYMKNDNDFLSYKKEIQKRLKSAKKIEERLTFGQQVKIFFYRNFNRISFWIKLRKRIM